MTTGFGLAYYYELAEELNTEVLRLRAVNLQLAIALANLIQSELLKQPRKVRLRFVDDGVAAIEANR